MAGAVLGLLLPLDAGPRWMQVASSINPLAHVVEAERALFAEQIGTTTVLAGASAAVATAVAGLAVGARTIMRSAG